MKLKELFEKNATISSHGNGTLKVKEQVKDYLSNCDMIKNLSVKDKRWIDPTVIDDFIRDTEQKMGSSVWTQHFNGNPANIEYEYERYVHDKFNLAMA